ncbi:DUF4864 domain-containing protein [Seohaeicola zhoushanensis]|uniref:DUF4864 domain-containing protein n=1 Tax=Seohaeicola zhoushanensis TaxID=1569283 RepID=A0A8J3GVL5_9RHOB|nr:DUF4864 domain-containing protein [Seohaeicola zhoushanensis]GHF44382.1 DUF4864 domain-containing protein [Seohaeicola zhoushanensis]
MRHTLFALLLAFALAAPVAAQDAGIEDTISRQIEAFKADDLARAFSFASPMIRGLFGNPENFGSMVRNGYPMVWRPADLRFLDLHDEGGRLYQKVQITDAQGRVHLLDYEMIETESGWKINGVRILEAPGVAA